MKIFESQQPLKQWLNEHKKPGNSLGFVPTMGALHEGHLSIVRQSVAENALTVCSIFVNPTQFNNKEDFEKYPINIERDIKLLTAAGCDALFIPHVKEIYPQTTYLSFDFGDLGHVLEGVHRPGHFSGVATILSKLFHIVQPDRAYFGMKDYQQLAIIRCMVRELSFPIEIIGCETVREASGLAMSSRNERLSTATRTKAGSIFHTLNAFSNNISVKNWPLIREQIIQNLTAQLPIAIEYVELGDPDTLQPLPLSYDKSYGVLFFAGVLEGVRLIDNITIKIS